MIWIFFILLAMLFICYAIHRMQKTIDRICAELIACQKQADIDRRENATKAQQVYMDLYFKLEEKDSSRDEAMLAIAAKIDEIEKKIK